MTVKQQHDKFIDDLYENVSESNIVHIDTAMDDVYCESQITLSLGDGWAGHYEGGYWGDCSIDDDELQITFSVGDIYEDGDFHIGEGIVRLTYSADNKGMAYTGQLDKEVGQALRDITNGMLVCYGSEQGMQDDTYLSVDIEVVDNTKQKTIVLQGSFA
jgi:hypothetical protein